MAETVKNPPANAGDLGSIPGLGRPPGGGHGNPLQYSCLENPTDRGAWGLQSMGRKVTKHSTQIMYDSDTSYYHGMEIECQSFCKGWEEGAFLTCDETIKELVMAPKEIYQRSQLGCFPRTWTPFTPDPAASAQGPGISVVTTVPNSCHHWWQTLIRVFPPELGIILWFWWSTYF